MAEEESREDLARLRFAREVVDLGRSVGVRVEAVDWSGPAGSGEDAVVTAAAGDVAASAVLAADWLTGDPADGGGEILTGVARALAIGLARGSGVAGPTRWLPRGGAVVPLRSSEAPSAKEPRWKIFW